MESDALVLPRLRCQQRSAWPTSISHRCLEGLAGPGASTQPGLGEHSVHRTRGLGEPSKAPRCVGGGVPRGYMISMPVPPDPLGSVRGVSGSCSLAGARSLCQHSPVKGKRAWSVDLQARVERGR